MAEILGVAAAAAQLAITCLSLLDQVKLIKGGSGTLKKYHLQLQDVRNLSELISTNPLLQTAEIESHTQALLLLIRDNCLSPLLTRGRLARSLSLLYRERDLAELFTNVERRKSNLSLLIEDIQARSLHQIQLNLEAMSNNSSAIPDNKSEKLPVAAPASGSKILVQRTDSTTTIMGFEGATSTNPYPAQATQSPNGIQNLLEGRSSEHSSSRKPKVAQYDNCTAGDNVNQINGATYQTNVPLSGRIEGPEGIFVYRNCNKYGRGRQRNAAEVHIPANSKPNSYAFVEMNGHWMGCTAEAGHDNSEKGTTFQFNGPGVMTTTPEDEL